MVKDLYCSMIHGGLNINVKHDPYVQSCCLRADQIPITVGESFWNNPAFESVRQQNISNQWDPGCANCEKLENSNLKSMRQGTNQGLGIHGRTGISGPARIDIMFDISCNLACRTCGPHSSTFWQKHLKENNSWAGPIFTDRKKDDVLRALSTLDLGNVRQVVFCGGETLLGQEYWDVAAWLADHVPNAKQNLILGFQTNGTQSISERNYQIIEKVHLTRLHISLDGTNRKFEYLRWPASWNHVTNNIFTLREKLPGNVMFLIEQTVSIFNVLYMEDVKSWAAENFSTNREGDVVNFSQHLAMGMFGLQNASKELVQRLQGHPAQNLIGPSWIEQPDRIRPMVDEIKRFDAYRRESFVDVFPETADTFRRYW